MSTVDDIKQKLDIVEVISGYLPLQKAGRGFRGLCPFHPEKTPSFYVDPERQSWHCFGCNTGGDLFSFVMKKEGGTFGDTLRLLAQRAGVSLDSQSSKKEGHAQRLREVCEAAAQYYHRLLRESEAAAPARAYLEKRGINAQTVEDFQIGYSLAQWEALRSHLAERGYKEKEQAEAGLLAEKEGRFFDLFRGRLMFPIRDSHGRPIGFGARALDDSVPKYINSPQTPVFDKSGTLYGLDRARASLREKGAVVIVEGYMDVIMAHQHGFSNVVGTMGTALSPKHIASLKGLAQGLVLALDPDRAGDQATLRGIEVARQALERETVSVPDWLGAESKLKGQVAVLSLPRGRDPDEVIRESPEGWEKLMKEALLLPDYLFKVTTEGRDLSSPSERSAVAQRLLPSIVEMADEVQRALYLGKLAHLLGVPERDLAALAARLHRTSGEKKAAARLSSLPDPPQKDPIERYALCLMLQHPELREKCLALQADDFTHAENRALWEAWKDGGTGNCREKIDEELREYLDSLLGRSLPPATDAMREQALSDCIRRLKEKRLRRLKEEEELLLSEGEAGGKVQDVASLAYDLWRGQGETEGQDQASARLARLQQDGIVINSELSRIFAEGAHRSKPSQGD